MQAKLYIGSIPGNTTEQELKAHFSSVCQMVTLILVKNKHNNKTNSGFGFLTVASAADVQKLMAMDHVLGGRKIKVEPFAEGNKLKEVRSSLMRKRLYISDIPEQVTDAHIEDFFGKFGQLESAYKVKVQSTKKPCTFGYVTFTAEEPARKLVELRTVKINGCKISIRYFEKEKDRVEPNYPSKKGQKANAQGIPKKSANTITRTQRPAQQEKAAKPPANSQESQHLAASKADKLQKRQGKKAQEDFELVRSQEQISRVSVPPLAEKNLQHSRTLSASASPRTDSHQTSSSGVFLGCGEQTKPQNAKNTNIVENVSACTPEFDRKGVVACPQSICGAHLLAKPTSKLYYQNVAGENGHSGRLQHGSDNVAFRCAVKRLH